MGSYICILVGYNFLIEMKIIANNRKARHNYEVVDTYETGIELKGNEVKSLRMKGCSLEESFARYEKGEIFLYNMHITEFEKSSYFACDPRRVRKLLLHKREILKIAASTTQKGATLVPLKVYFNKRNLVKVELAVAKGRHVYDKRKKLKEDIIQRETDRTMKNYRSSNKQL